MPTRNFDNPRFWNDWVTSECFIQKQFERPCEPHAIENHFSNLLGNRVGRLVAQPLDQRRLKVRRPVHTCELHLFAGAIDNPLGIGVELLRDHKLGHGKEERCQNWDKKCSFGSVPMIGLCSPLTFLTREKKRESNEIDVSSMSRCTYIEGVGVRIGIRKCSYGSISMIGCHS